MLVPVTLSDRERRNANGQTSPDDLRKYAPTVLSRMTKFAVVTLVGRGVFLKGRGSTVPKKFWDPTYARDKIKTLTRGTEACFSGLTLDMPPN